VQLSLIFKNSFKRLGRKKRFMPNRPLYIRPAYHTILSSECGHFRLRRYPSTIISSHRLKQHHGSGPLVVNQPVDPRSLIPFLILTHFLLGLNSIKQQEFSQSFSPFYFYFFFFIFPSFHSIIFPFHFWSGFCVKLQLFKWEFHVRPKLYTVAD
jgi:hypothetical protein